LPAFFWQDQSAERLVRGLNDAQVLRSLAQLLLGDGKWSEVRQFRSVPSLAG